MFTAVVIDSLRNVQFDALRLFRPLKANHREIFSSQWWIYLFHSVVNRQSALRSAIVMDVRYRYDGIEWTLLLDLLSLYFSGLS